jgi:hypothetical protein
LPVPVPACTARCCPCAIEDQTAWAMRDCPVRSVPPMPWTASDSSFCTLESAGDLSAT